MALQDEPTDRLDGPSVHTGRPAGARARPSLQAEETHRIAPEPTVRWSWRTVTAAVLGVAAVALYGWAMLSRPGPPPSEHVNGRAGFSIAPPPGWTDRTDDRDGTFIRQGPNGDPRASLTVSTRLARDPDPRMALRDMKARGASGPIRDLKWEETQEITLDSGLPGVLAEFTQVYRGVPMHGWAVLAVHDARLLHAVGTVPEALVPDQQLQLVAALHTLAPLRPDVPDEELPAVD